MFRGRVVEDTDTNTDQMYLYFYPNLPEKLCRKYKYCTFSKMMLFSPNASLLFVFTQVTCSPRPSWCPPTWTWRPLSATSCWCWPCTTPASASWRPPPSPCPWSGQYVISISSDQDDFRSVITGSFGCTHSLFLTFCQVKIKQMLQKTEKNHKISTLHFVHSEVLTQYCPEKFIYWNSSPAISDI